MRAKIRWWRYQVYKWWHERLPSWFAWKLPKKVAYWAAIRVIAHGTQGVYRNQVVPELTAMEAIERWYKDYEQKQPKRSKTPVDGVLEEIISIQDVRTLDRSEGEAPAKP